MDKIALMAITIAKCLLVIGFFWVAMHFIVKFWLWYTDKFVGVVSIGILMFLCVILALC